MHVHSNLCAVSDLLLFPSEVSMHATNQRSPSEAQGFCSCQVETFGNVTLEGMASGLPCIVDQRCSSHLVKNDVNGYTVCGGDANQYYQLTRRLCDGVEGAQLRMRLGNEGRRK